MAGGTDLQLERPRGAIELIGLTVDLYFRFPLLWLSLAGPVVIPYEVIVLLVTGHGPLQQGRDHLLAGQIVGLVSIGLVGPLVSALHVRAVREIRDGNVPDLATVAKRSLAALPIVSIAVIVSYFGAILGLVALIVPGVLLYLRWAVVAQAAALERNGWRVALHRSAELTKGNYPHVFGVLFLDLVILGILSAVLRVGFGDHTTGGSFLAGTACEVVLWSFGALVYALLFFDLRARSETPDIDAATAPNLYPSPSSVDPGRYADEDRPPGWYVNPDKPWRMRYWAEDGEPGWSRRTKKTPKGTLAEWKDLRWAREKKST